MGAKRQRDNRASVKGDSGRADSGARGQVNYKAGKVTRFHYRPTIAARMAVTV